MATLYAVHVGYGRPEICDTLEEAQDTARALDFSKYGSPAPTIEKIDAKLPNDAGIRTVFDIIDTDAGGYRMAFFPATIGPDTHTDFAGDGPFCADCARAMLPAMEEDETFFAEPEYESTFGESCEQCGKVLCEPYCQICRDVREETDQREWLTSDSYGYVCPRCAADARIRASKGDAALPRGKYQDYAMATRLAPGVYDLTMYEHDGTYNGKGIFYAPSCGHHVKDV